MPTAPLEYKFYLDPIFEEIERVLAGEDFQHRRHDLKGLYAIDPEQVVDWVDLKRTEGEYDTAYPRLISALGAQYLFALLHAQGAGDIGSVLWTEGDPEIRLFNHLYKIIDRSNLSDDEKYRLLGALRMFTYRWMYDALKRSDNTVGAQLQLWEQWREEPIFAAHRHVLGFGKTEAVKTIDKVIKTLKDIRKIAELAVQVETHFRGQAASDEFSEFSKRAGLYIFINVAKSFEPDHNSFFQQLEWQEDGSHIRQLNALFNTLLHCESIGFDVSYERLGTIRNKAFEWAQRKIGQFDADKQIESWRSMVDAPIFAQHRMPHAGGLSGAVPPTRTVRKINDIISTLEYRKAAAARVRERELARNAVVHGSDCAASLFHHNPAFTTGAPSQSTNGAAAAVEDTDLPNP
ncbi:MAG: hypothetical protein K0U29_05455 [Gammaproteobacteria bacterium]|nr:hypothetical protein [Gammaproteobacteria bacterium]MCH9744364.1 hypothetical protein [Gammaproteobacteria bacterium]